MKEAKNLVFENKLIFLPVKSEGMKEALERVRAKDHSDDHNCQHKVLNRPENDISDQVVRLAEQVPENQRHKNLHKNHQNRPNLENPYLGELSMSKRQGPESEI